MSYGRSPYYIYSDGAYVYFQGQDVECAVPEAALAQYIASMANRGDAELASMVEIGKALRPEISRTLTVTVSGHGWEGESE